MGGGFSSFICLLGTSNHDVTGALGICIAEQYVLKTNGFSMIQLGEILN